MLDLFAVGRFFELFIRVDSPKLALGHDNAQWTSIAMVIVVIAGWTYTSRRHRQIELEPQRNRASHAAR